MSGPLATNLRKSLGRAIVQARQVAEAGARRALESLAVQRHEPHGSMSVEERTLRNRLRARGRQLGDVRDKQRGSQSIDHLVHEVAYEHWHRMLFARFLAENGLLIHPEHQVAVSLIELAELARDAGEDPNAMAARFAQDSLPQIFRSGDPVLDVVLAPETRQALEKLLDSLAAAVFTADDSLGWTYQYWQSEKKDEVNKSGNKIGADELPAVTQLFTEHYMVLFLYHNTIGAWHAGKVLAGDPSLAETAESEEELRKAVCLHSQEGYDFEYLRFVRDTREGDEEGAPTGPWRPAAGTFEAWPQAANELKVLDPCCGSGHFLTEGLELLVRLRMDEERLELEDAISGVLADNLHGLELDPRCTQIAAFNLAMAAWKLAGRAIELPSLSIACSGLAVGSTKTEWAKLAGDNDRIRAGMDRLYELFEQAPELGSLIDPNALEGDMLVADFTELRPLLEQALAREPEDIEGTERAVAAHGMVRGAELLSGEYTLVATNVPYLGRGQQSETLREHAEDIYREARADLATIFVERMLRWLGGAGTVAAVTPQNWLFLTRYKSLREKLLASRTWDFVARLGPKAFQTPMWDFNVMLLVLSGTSASDRHAMAGIDASPAKTAASKASLLRGETAARLGRPDTDCAVHVVLQAEQVLHPNSVIRLERASGLPSLGQVATVRGGITTGDSLRFRRCHFEIETTDTRWAYQQGTVGSGVLFGGRHLVLLWQNGSGELASMTGGKGATIAGREVWGRDGVAISYTGRCSSTLYSGCVFENVICVAVPREEQNLALLWAFCQSDGFAAAVRANNQKLSVDVRYFEKADCDIEHWQKVVAEEFPDGLPEPQSSDPTQWLFHGHPARAEPATILQAAVGRLLGYRWPPELDREMRLADEARVWVARCNALYPYADEDGIVCLSATRGERCAADRLRELLSAAFGSDWSAARERELLAVAGGGKKPASSLDVWLRDRFFEEHCRLFHHRPFIWHIWDGNKDGFHCLVNAHKLTGPDGEGRRTLEAVTYSYLGDWIDRQKADQAEGREGADARLAAAHDLRGQLKKILEGEPPNDLFVRWKPLHEQAIGWEPDINDGVRLNIRPFMSAELRKGGKKGAGVLRWKPNIKWKKDRGKEPQSLRPKTDFPWFWSCPGEGTVEDRTDFTGDGEFDGNRWNDLHYTIATKRAAREDAGKE